MNMVVISIAYCPSCKWWLKYARRCVLPRHVLVCLDKGETSDHKDCPWYDVNKEGIKEALDPLGETSWLVSVWYNFPKPIRALVPEDF
jgi:hypothetical protein